MAKKIKKRSDGRYEQKIAIEKNGTVRYKSVYGHTKAELERKVQKEYKKIDAEYNPLFSEIADEWLEEHRQVISLATYKSYDASLKDINTAFQGVPIRSIRPLDIQRYLDQKAAQSYSFSYVNHALIVFRLIFKYALLKGIMTVNPCAPVTMPKCKPKKKVKMPSPHDLQAVLDNVDAPFGLFPYMLYFTGMRKGELLALRYEDISNGYIHVNKAVIFDGNRPIVRPQTKTSAGMRNIPLLEPLEKVLPKGKGLIFHDGQGNPLTNSAFYKDWKMYLKSVGADFTPHQLRHAFATLCYDANLSPKDAQTILGHSSEQITLNIYTEISKSREEHIRDSLNRYVTKK